MITYHDNVKRAGIAEDSADCVVKDALALVRLIKDIGQAQMRHDEADWRHDSEVARGVKLFTTPEEVKGWASRDYEDALTAARECLEQIKQDLLRVETDLGRLEK